MNMKKTILLAFLMLLVTAAVVKAQSTPDECQPIQYKDISKNKDQRFKTLEVNPVISYLTS
jgi:hypothetical protein